MVGERRVRGRQVGASTMGLVAPLASDVESGGVGAMDQGGEALLSKLSDGPASRRKPNTADKSLTAGT